MHNRPLAVRVWLWTGVVMIVVQIALGGITRLTGSGLSITRWDIVTGTIPPLNEDEWMSAFEMYRETPQYQKINAGMSLSEFKFIYFWEYIHRLWARSIGVVFLLPFLVFAWLGWIDRKLLRQLAIAVFLGACAAIFGWIMVASGLINRPWVNAYKLTIHLNIAMLLCAWLTWVAIGERKRVANSRLKQWLNVFTVVLALQLVFGGLMSGMKAGVYYPTWPDMHGEFFPKALTDSDLWSWESVIHYEKGLVPGIVQFMHRMIGYTLFIVGCVLFWIARGITKMPARIAVQLLLIAIILQMCLGIMTVTQSIGRIPLLYGVLHQIGAIGILMILTYLQRKISD